RHLPQKPRIGSLGRLQDRRPPPSAKQTNGRMPEPSFFTPRGAGRLLRRERDPGADGRAVGGAQADALIADVWRDALVDDDAARAIGYRGKGVTVALLDTGVDDHNPDLADTVAAEHRGAAAPPTRFVQTIVSLPRHDLGGSDCGPGRDKAPAPGLPGKCARTPGDRASPVRAAP